MALYRFISTTERCCRFGAVHDVAEAVENSSAWTEDKLHWLFSVRRDGFIQTKLQALCLTHMLR